MKLNEIAELLKSARTDIVNKNFIAAVTAINVALDELEPRITRIDTD